MSTRYAGNDAIGALFPFPEEVANGVHDRVLALDLRDDQAVVDVEVFVEVLDELSGAVGALDLAVAEQVHLRKDVRLQELDALDSVVDRPVVTVAEVKRVDVPLAGRKI